MASYSARNSGTHSLQTTFYPEESSWAILREMPRSATQLLAQDTSQRNDSESRQTAREIQLIQADQFTSNNEQYLRNSCVQEVTPDIRRKQIHTGTSVWISSATLYHRPS
jgi:hypothetical protein